MTQAFLFTTLQLLGTVVCLAVGPRRRPMLCAALGFPIGLAAMVMLLLAIFAVGVPFTRASGAALYLAALGAALLGVRRGGWPPRSTWLRLAGFSVGFAACATALTRYNWEILTYDSHYLIMMGRILGEDGSFAPETLQHLGNYGIFQVLAHALFVFTRENHLWGLTPVFALSAAVAFAMLLAAALDAQSVPRFRGRALAVALVAAAAFSSYMLFRHAFYPQTNFGSATYLLIFAALYWLAEVEQEPSALPLSFLALTALALHRIEAPLLCLIFLSLTLLPGELPRRRTLPLLAGYTAVIVGWYLLLAANVLPTSKFLTPSRCQLIAGLTGAFLVGAALPLPQRLRRAMPALVAAVLAIGLVVTFAKRPEHMSGSAKAWLSGLLTAPHWRGVWPALLALALVALALPAPRLRWPFVVGVPATLALTLLLVYERTPYYDGMGDSAARMAIHPLPIAFFYLGLKFLPLLSPAPAPAQASGSLGGGAAAEPAEPAEPRRSQ